MARVTIEDCRKLIVNRFELIIIAAHRAREISLGSPALVQSNDDKDVVLALKEIAGDKINIDAVKDEVIKKHQKYCHSNRGGHKDFVDDEVSELFAISTDTGIPPVNKKDDDLVYQDENEDEA